jgi:prepilin peptidase CpaA
VEASLAGLVVAIALLIFPFAMGGIGAGDVKMMGAIGAMLGPQLAVRSLVAGMILGGIVMLAHLARVGRLREKLGATIRMVWAAVVTRSLTPLRKPAEVPDALALPYSVPLGLGTLLAFWLLTLRP